jgi:hypothetical protein
MSAFDPLAVVRVPFPFTNRQNQKRRPALVHSQPGFQQSRANRFSGMNAHPVGITVVLPSEWQLLLHGQKLLAAKGWKSALASTQTR